MATNNSPFSWQNGVDTTANNVNFGGNMPTNPFANTNTGNNINIPVNKPFMQELEPQAKIEAEQIKFNPKIPQITEQKAQSIFNAYINGIMDEQAKLDYESDIQSGKVKLPFTVNPEQVKTEIKSQKQETFNPNNLPVFNPNQKQELPKSVIDAYNNGTMDAQAKTELEQDIKNNIVSIPQGLKLNNSTASQVKLTPEQIAYINTDPAPYDNTEQAKQAKKIRIQNVTNDIAEQNKSFTQKAIESLVGAGETGLALTTGATTGYLGTLADAISGKSPNQTGLGEALSYQPKTSKGQEYTQNLGQFINDSGIGGLAPELAKPTGAKGIANTMAKAEAVGAKAINLADTAKTVATDIAKNTKETVKEATTKIPEPTIIEIPKFSNKIDNETLITTLKEAGEGKTKAKIELNKLLKQDPKILETDLPIKEALQKGKVSKEANIYINQLNDSVGAMKTNEEFLRLNRAAEFNTPLTKGEATRDRRQLQLETEDIGKNTNVEIGGQYEAFKKRQEHQLQGNFDIWIDEKIGARQTEDLGAGGTVKQALTQRLNKEKAKTTQAYNLANASKEASQKVPTNDLVSFLNDNKVEAQTVGSVLDYAKRKLVATGGAVEQNGDLIAKDLTRKDLELIRRSIGNEAQTNATNMQYGTALKKTIDKMTEAIDKENNGLYQKARMQKQLTAQKFENKSIVADLLAPKRTKGDAKIADEKVVQRVINAPVEDIKFIRNLLVNSGDEGKQAWRELQGGLLRHIKNKATSGVKGELSPDKLNKVITSFTKDEKLKVFFGQRSIDYFNDFNQLVKDIKVLPTGISNASGTAHALKRMLQNILSKAIPYAKDTPILRIFLENVENRKLKIELAKALNYKR